MKSYIYIGTSNLTFSFNEIDYMVYGKGPHQLPEASAIVQSNISAGKLALADQTKIKNSNPER